eukprot:6091102-Amphidinium_carterae.1
MLYNQTDQAKECHEQVLTTIQTLLEEAGHKREYSYTSVGYAWLRQDKHAEAMEFYLKAPATHNEDVRQKYVDVVQCCSDTANDH